VCHLHGKGIAGMAASIDDVERWDWQDLQRTQLHIRCLLAFAAFLAAYEIAHN